MASQQICLKWNSFQNNIVTSFEHLWEEEGLVDVTLASEGQCIRAHKIILSACSPFFRRIFESNPCQHPVIILQDVHFPELEALLCFVYKGEVNIEQDDLPALLKAAESLQIRGLCGAGTQSKPRRDSSDAPPAKRQRSNSASFPPPPLPAPPPLHRARNKRRASAAVAEERIASPPPATLAKTEPNTEPLCEDSESLASLPLEESMDEGAPEDLHTIIQQPSRSSGPRHGEKLSLADINQLKGCCRTDSLAFHPDLNFDPLAQGDKNVSFPPFPCPFCDRAYTSWGFRRRHIKSMHTQSPQLSCKWCSQVLSSHEVWEQHVTMKHGLSPEDAHNGLLILEEAHMVLQIPNPTRLDSLVDMIKRGEAVTETGDGGPSRETVEETRSSNGSATPL